MGVELVDRPAQCLWGLMWEGTYAQAAAKGVHDVIRAMADARGTLPVDPHADLIGISWNDRPAGFRYLVAVAVDGIAGPVPTDLVELRLPAMRLASLWHEAGDAHGAYLDMFVWMSAQGLRRDFAICHHREEYPVDFDLSVGAPLRLMTPAVLA